MRDKRLPFRRKSKKGGWPAEKASFALAQTGSFLLVTVFVRYPSAANTYLQNISLRNKQERCVCFSPGLPVS